MFGKKKKNARNIPSYDEQKFNWAHDQWMQDKPPVPRLDLPESIYNSSGEDVVYFHWDIPRQAVGINIFGEKGKKYQAFIKDYHVDFLYYTLVACREGHFAIPQGVVLEGESFYLDIFIDKGLKIERTENEYYYLTWIDYRQIPVYSYSFMYSSDRIDLWIAALRTFLEGCKMHQTEYKNWQLRKPQTWQYPPIRDEE